MNAQPEESGKSKAGIVLQAAEQGRGGPGIRVSGNGRPLPDIDRNLQSTFLDSWVDAERDFCMARQVRNITQNKDMVKILNRFTASAGRRTKTRLHFWGGQHPPENLLETFISEPPHALKNWAWGRIPQAF
jgi:hypothetical protein